MIGSDSSETVRAHLFDSRDTPPANAAALARRLRAQWLRLVRAAQWLAPRHLQIVLRERMLRAGGPPALGHAEDELSGLLTRELARLLRHAASLVVPGCPAPAGEAIRLDVLRAALIEELASASRCERRPPAAYARLFDACIRSQPDAWPDAIAFALAAQALEDCELGRRIFVAAVARHDPHSAAALDLDRFFDGRSTRGTSATHDPGARA